MLPRGHQDDSLPTSTGDYTTHKHAQAHTSSNHAGPLPTHTSLQDHMEMLLPHACVLQQPSMSTHTYVRAGSTFQSKRHAILSAGHHHIYLLEATSVLTHTLQPAHPGS